MEGLHYTPSSLKEMEDLAKRSFLDLISEPSITSVTLFLRFGLKIQEPEAERLIEDWIANKSGFLELYMEIVKVLSKQGFLSKNSEEKLGGVSKTIQQLAQAVETPVETPAEETPSA